jgi:hypothetical protein
MKEARVTESRGCCPSARMRARIWCTESMGLELWHRPYSRSPQAVRTRPGIPVSGAMVESTVPESMAPESMGKVESTLPDSTGTVESCTALQLNKRNRHESERYLSKVSSRFGDDAQKTNIHPF